MGAYDPMSDSHVHLCPQLPPTDLQGQEQIAPQLPAWPGPPQAAQWLLLSCERPCPRAAPLSTCGSWATHSQGSLLEPHRARVMQMEASGSHLQSLTTHSTSGTVSLCPH